MRLLERIYIVLKYLIHSLKYSFKFRQPQTKSVQSYCYSNYRFAVIIQNYEYTKELLAFVHHTILFCFIFITLVGILSNKRYEFEKQTGRKNEKIGNIKKLSKRDTIDEVWATIPSRICGRRQRGRSGEDCRNSQGWGNNTRAGEEANYNDDTKVLVVVVMEVVVVMLVAEEGTSATGRRKRDREEGGAGRDVLGTWGRRRRTQKRTVIATTSPREVPER